MIGFFFAQMEKKIETQGAVKAVRENTLHRPSSIKSWGEIYSPA